MTVATPLCTPTHTLFRLQPVMGASVKRRDGREVLAAEFIPLGLQRQHVGACPGVVGIGG